MAGRRAVYSGLFGVIAWLCCAIGFAAPAAAHAEIVATTPGDGYRLAEPPAVVSVTFSEAVRPEPGNLRVVDQWGRQVDTAEPAHGDSADTIVVPLPAGLANAGYLVSFAVVSEDGHPVHGAFAFVVGDGPLLTASGAVADSTGADPVVGVAFWIIRLVSYAGLVLAGGLVFVTVAWPRGRASRAARRVILTGCACLGVGALGALLLQGPYATGDGIAVADSPRLLAATLGLPVGRLLVLRVAAAAVLAAAVRALWRGADPARVHRAENVAVGAAIALLVSFSAAGHSSGDPMPTASVLVDMIHLAAVATWLGGLVLLARCLLPGRAAAGATELAAALPRFSAMAIGSVATIVVTGSYQAWRRLASVPALLSTDYGRMLLFKACLVVVILVLGNASRRIVQRRFAPRPAPAVGHGGAGLLVADAPIERHLEVAALRRWVGWEAAVAAAVLAVTSLLVSTAPPDAARPQPVRQAHVAGDLRAAGGANLSSPGTAPPHSLGAQGNSA